MLVSGASGVEAGIFREHCNDVIMGMIASQISSLTMDYSTVYSDADQRKHQCFASLAFVREFTGNRWIPAQMAGNVENVSIRWRHYEASVNIIAANTLYAHVERISAVIQVSFWKRTLRDDVTLVEPIPRMILAILSSTITGFSYMCYFSVVQWSNKKCILLFPRTIKQVKS